MHMKHIKLVKSIKFMQGFWPLGTIGEYIAPWADHAHLVAFGHYWLLVGTEEFTIVPPAPTSP